MEGDEQVSEEDVAVPDDEWPYDPTWVDLGASPLISDGPPSRRVTRWR
jgi:hypothetical protein